MSEKLTVHKFGGGDLGSRGERIPYVDNVLDLYKGDKIITVSAFDGATKKLKAGQWTEVIALYRSAGETYIHDSTELEKYVKVLGWYEDRLRGGRRLISEAELWGLGELLSAELLFRHRKLMGRKATKIEFDDSFPIRAKNYKPKDGEPDLEGTKSRIGILDEAFENNEEVFSPGYLAYTNDGQVVTLGDGGSDTTAFMYAYAKGIPQVTLWKETEGVRTANPDDVPDTKLIEWASLSEGLNMSLFIAKIMNHKGTRISYDHKIGIKVHYIKNPNIVTKIVKGSEVPDDWQKRLAKYIGGTDDALQISIPYNMFGEFVEKIVANNLGDFTHIVGPLLYPQLIILDRKKVYEMELTDQEKKLLDKGRRVCVISVVGDGLGPARNVLEKSARISQFTPILGNVASVRNGIQDEGAYMSFVHDYTKFVPAIRWFHKEFIEDDPSWNV